MGEMMGEELGLGLDTFGDVTRNASGELISDAETIRNVVEQAVLPTRSVWPSSESGSTTAPSSRSRVRRSCCGRGGAHDDIHLGTAVTVLSSDDPVRVYERFATLDAISRGRAEVILGRGSFIESFPLFGYDLR